MQGLAADSSVASISDKLEEIITSQVVELWLWIRIELPLKSRSRLSVALLMDNITEEAESGQILFMHFPGGWNLVNSVK